MLPSLVVESRPSRTCLALCLVLASAIPVLLLLSRAPLGVQVPVALVAWCGLWRILRSGGWFRGTAQAAVAHGEQGWRLRLAGESDWEAVQLLPDYLVWPHLVVLRLQRAGGSLVAVVLWPDSAAADSLRRLRVLLRWSPDAVNCGAE